MLSMRNNDQSSLIYQLPQRACYVLALAVAALFFFIGETVPPQAADKTLPPLASPQETKPAVVVQDQATFTKSVQPFFVQYCGKCHGPKLAEGKLRLDTLPADFLNRPASGHWVEVLNRINVGEMPPADEPKPTAAELELVTDWITSELGHARAAAQSTGGKILLRRMTRFEYANTVKQLLNIEFVQGEGPLEKLPPDGSIAGFDRVSKALMVDPSLMEAYLNVAQDIADRAITFRPPLVPDRVRRYEFPRMAGTPMSYQLNSREFQVEGNQVVIWDGMARTYSKLGHPFNNREIPLTGKYRIRVKAAADRGTRGDPIYMDVHYGAVGRQARFRVDAPRDKPMIYEFDKTFDSSEPGEFQVGIVNGTRFRTGNQEWYHENGELTKLAETGHSKDAMRRKARLRAEGAYDHYVRSSYVSEVLHLEPLPKLYLEWIEVVGPLQGDFPPPSLTSLFGDLQTARKFSASVADRQTVLAMSTQVFARLLPRAFRRPVRPEEIQGLVRLVDAELTAGAEPQRALKAGIVAMLCSPDFLFLFEPAAAESTASRTLTDHELATRLSYFLWSSLPDAELRQVADSNTLHDAAVLKHQTDRMLADPQMEGFVQGFARQWLKVDEISRFAPDQQIYPAFYATDMAGIEHDVKQELLAFFREILLRDESVVNFLDSDWLILNERLAKLYGIQGVEGPDLRRVALNRSAKDALNSEPNPASACRGGLLGMAGVHLWGADGNRTKPVERGKYLLTVLFNSPPPPPPPNAGEVEPNLGGQILTVRERLTKHRQQATCNNCHRRIDPYGLAMENFNVIGQWRDKLDGEKPLAHWGDNRPAVDPSGTLPNGREFKDFLSFKQAVIEQQDRFVRALTEKLLVYALGRTLEPEDRTTISNILTSIGKDKPTFRRLLQGVISSEPFRTK
jgi:mono/diheme cytochrome c family protein